MHIHIYIYIYTHTYIHMYACVHVTDWTLREAAQQHELYRATGDCFDGCFYLS